MAETQQKPKIVLPEHWHLIRCQTGMTTHAVARLLERKIQAYVPKTFHREKFGREVRIIATLRLPGQYAFVQLQDDPKNPQLVIDQAGVVAAERGVSHVFTNDAGRPYRIPFSEIVLLMQLEADEYCDAGKPPSRAKPNRFVPGQTVKIVRHELWAGYEGEIVTAARGMARIVVGNMIVSIPDCDVTPQTDQELRNSA